MRNEKILKKETKGLNFQLISQLDSNYSGPGDLKGAIYQS